MACWPPRTARHYGLGLCRSAADHFPPQRLPPMAVLGQRRSETQPALKVVCYRFTTWETSGAADDGRRTRVPQHAALGPRGGRPPVVFGFTIAKIVGIEIFADPARLRELDPAILDD